MKPVSAAQMRQIDEKSEKEFKVTSLELMENAGRAAAELAAMMIKTMSQKHDPASVTVCCGRGNNGGDGIACARALKKWGIDIKVFMVPPGEKPAKIEVQKQLEAAKKEGLEIKLLEDPSSELPQALDRTDLIVDALLGTGSKGKPAGVVMKAIQKMMKSGKPILAVDIPSGIDADTGYHTGVFITAAKTITFGLPKTGLLKPHAQKNVGELVVADIGHPKELLAAYR